MPEMCNLELLVMIFLFTNFTHLWHCYLFRSFEVEIMTQADACQRDAFVKMSVTLSDESLQKVLHFHLLQQVVDKLSLDGPSNSAYISKHLPRARSLLSRKMPLFSVNDDEQAADEPQNSVQLNQKSDAELSLFLNNLWQRARVIATDGSSLPEALRKAALKVESMDPNKLEPAFLPALFAFATEYYTHCIARD